MIDLQREIENCESAGLECAVFYAINFPRIYENVPTMRHIARHVAARKCKLKINGGGKPIWVKIVGRDIPGTVIIEREFNLRFRIPYSAIFEIN